MPHPDKLYSMNDDSDGDDYADQPSPSDGYFASSSPSNTVPTVPDILVPDPTCVEPKSKVEEVEGERLLDTQKDQSCYRPVESAAYYRQSDQSKLRAASAIATSQRHHNPANAHTHLQSSASHTFFPTYPRQGQTSSVYSEAPPAYSPSPLPSAGQHTQSRNYSTFSSAMGVTDVENERLLGRGPESMGQPGGDEEEATGSVWRRRMRRRLPRWLSWKIVLLALIILIVSIGFLASSFRITREDDHKKTIGAEPVLKAPDSEEPQMPDGPGDTGDPVVAVPFQPTYCADAQYRFTDQILALNFDRSLNVTFIEGQHAHPGHNQVRVGGQVDVRRLDSGGEARMVLEIATNDKDILLDVFTDEEAQAMKVTTPKKYDSPIPGQWPCVEMRATIWVPEDAEIGVLGVGAVHLDVLLLDDLSLHVAGYTRISSVMGDIHSGADRPASYGNSDIMTIDDPDYTFVPAKDSYVFDSRVIEVSTTGGRIDGNWPLYDVLGLHTTSGDIKVSVTPKEELKSDPKSAVLSLSSISGQVHATEPVHSREQIPLRDYLVDVKSTSGGIHGAFAFSAGIDLKSVASDIALDLLPVINLAGVSPEEPAQMETATTSGTTAVRVLEPVWFGGTGDAASESATRPFNCLQALHKSTSGDIGLRYPQSWEGDLHAETTSGKLKVRGKDVKILKSTGGWPGSKMHARKGPGGAGSTIQVHALMGTMDAIIGEE
ncbi:hypothetical protein F4779DRAFT_616413 [Xylariaceae sp. FL0662B]|nr:hypothetical protein F4779DRAFT_616413 [Xylariaceae sp. FL0662B]